MISSDGREMSRAGLLEDAPIVIDGHDDVIAANASEDIVAKFFDRYLRTVLSNRVKAVGQGQAMELAQINAVILDAIQRDAAVEHFFVIKAPDAFPRLSGINLFSNGIFRL